ncbi:hypothetical protein D3C85_1625730 [compost metagenome]
MDEVIVTVIVQEENERRIDLEIPVSLSVRKCKEMLRLANWMPQSDNSKFEVSLTGEEWNVLEDDVELSDVIYGDGAYIRVTINAL